MRSKRSQVQLEWWSASGQSQRHQEPESGLRELIDDGHWFHLWRFRKRPWGHYLTRPRVSDFPTGRPHTWQSSQLIKDCVHQVNEDSCDICGSLPDAGLLNTWSHCSHHHNSCKYLNLVIFKTLRGWVGGYFEARGCSRQDQDNSLVYGDDLLSWKSTGWRFLADESYHG